ncbi:MAG: hypothetical protein LC689_10105 [Myxococcales bacterium]|nr:hypothetical protein [Myxococcales bacterium]
MHVCKLVAPILLGLLLTTAAAAQTGPDAGTGAAPESASARTAGTKKSRKKSAAKSSKKTASKKRKRKKARVAAPVAPAPVEAVKVPEDHEPPILTHTPVITAKKGIPFTIAVNAADQSGVVGPTLYLRKKGAPASDYVSMRMSAAGPPGEYALEVPAALVSVDALEYYIEAWDEHGNGPARVGSPDNPLAVSVEQEKKVVIAPPPVAPAAVVIAEPKGATPASAPTTVLQATREQPLESATSAIVAAPAPKKPIEPPSGETLIGLGIDAGFPGGGGLSLLVRPLWWLRLNGGLAYNYVGLGYRGGISLAPCFCVVTPTLNLDAGHYVNGDWNKVSNVTDPNAHALLSRVSYTFATAQLGLEFGSQRWFNFYLRGGLAYFETGFSGSDLTSLAQGKIASDPSTTYKVGDGKLKSLAPCVSLGANTLGY